MLLSSVLPTTPLQVGVGRLLARTPMAQPTQAGAIYTCAAAKSVVSRHPLSTSRVNPTPPDQPLQGLSTRHLLPTTTHANATHLTRVRWVGEGLQQGVTFNRSNEAGASPMLTLVHIAGGAPMNATTIAGGDHLTVMHNAGGDIPTVMHNAGGAIVTTTNESPDFPGHPKCTHAMISHTVGPHMVPTTLCQLHFIPVGAYTTSRWNSPGLPLVHLLPWLRHRMKSSGCNASS